MMSNDELRYTTIDESQPPAPRWPATSFEPGVKAVAIGAWCTIRLSPRPRPGHCNLSVKIDEFADLSDGSRVSLRWDRGVTASWDSSDGDVSLSEADVLMHVEGGLLPDEGEYADVRHSRSWHTYARLLAEMGVAMSADELKALPYLTEFSPELQSNLRN